MTTLLAKYGEGDKLFTKIDELLWTDKKFKSLSDDAKFLFIYALTCPHRNILGLYFLPIPYGSFDLGWDAKRFDKGLRELLEKGFINYNFNTSIIFIKNFLKYNPLENPNQVKGAMKSLKSIPANGVDTELINYLEGLDKPFTKPLTELLKKRLTKQVDVDVDVDVDIEEEKIYRKIQHLILTEEEFIKLSEIYNKSSIDDILDRMDNYAKIKNYTSAYKTALNWLKRDNTLTLKPQKTEEEKPWMKDFIPEGD